MLSLEQRQQIDREETKALSVATRAEDQPPTKTTKTAVTHEYLRGRFLPTLLKATDRQVRALVQPAIDELAQRIAALERQQKALRYRGVHQRAEIYEKNNLCTHDGSLWIALTDEPGKPGDGDGWQLVAKGGAR